MINSQIDYSITPGSIVTPIYEWNAEITSGKLDILLKNGTIVPGHYTSQGDKIIVLNVFTAENVALIQYPTPEGYRQGYVENSLLNEVVKYRFKNWWQNGSTSQQILQNNGDELTVLPAYAPATILFETPDGYTCIAYGYGNGMPNQSGFSSYGGLFGGIKPFQSRDYPANGETTAQSISIIDYNGIPLSDRFTSQGDQITILDILKDGQLALIEYPVDDDGITGFRKGFIPNFQDTNFVFNDWDNFINDTNQNIPVYNTMNLQDELNVIRAGEKATVLFETESVICVAYNTSEGLHIGSGYISKSYAELEHTFKIGDTVEILKDAEWFARGQAVDNRKSDIFIIINKINITLEGNDYLAYTIKDCVTEEVFNIYPQNIELTKERPVRRTGSTSGTPTEGTGSTSGTPTGGTGSTSGTPAGGTGSTSGTPTGGTGSTSGTPTGGTGSTSGTPTEGTGSTSGTPAGGTGSINNLKNNDEIDISGSININVNVKNNDIKKEVLNEITELKEKVNTRLNNMDIKISNENINMNNSLTDIMNNLNAISSMEKNNKVKISSLEDELAVVKEMEKENNESLNTQVMNNKTEIDELKTEISIVKENNLTITQTIAATENKVNDIKKNLGITGGINLITQQSNFGAVGSISNEYGFNSAEVNLVAGRTYTFTACGCSSQQAIENNQFLAIELYNLDWSVCKELEFKEVTPTIKQITFSVPKTEKFIITSYAMPQKNNSGDVTLYWYNVQEGEVGTSWVPSLYDLQNILTNKEEV